MNRSPKKQNEIEERETTILDVAARVFLSDGYHSLNMENIADEIGCSKGTVYGHFRNKEDILMELASRGVEKRAEMFSQAAAFAGRPRERMVVLWMSIELYVRAYPEYFASELILRTETLREKAAPERQEFMRGCENRCIQIVAGIVRDGVALRDLHLPDGMSAEELAFGVWSLTYGAHGLLQTGTPMKSMGVKNPFQSILYNANIMLDGVGWKPLSTELDYQSIQKQAAKTLFEDEVKLADRR